MEIYAWRPRNRLSDALATNSRWYSKNFPATGITNFGDELGPWIVNRILRNSGIFPTRKQLRQSSPTLFTVGSVISLARKGDVVWGSGHIGTSNLKFKHNPTSLRIHALRGPLTRGLLETELGFDNLPKVYGDPALLIPQLFPEIEPVKSRGDALVISHIDDQAPNLQNSNIEFVYATEPFIKIVSRIAGANKVITSSLHGKILADAFQVPNVVYQGKTTSKFKFDDYALGSGNEGFTILENLDQALGSAPLPALKFEGVTERLLGAFPFYLWD